MHLFLKVKGEDIVQLLGYDTYFVDLYNIKIRLELVKERNNEVYHKKASY